MIRKEVHECFATAEKDEQKGRKHKGLLFTKLDQGMFIILLIN